MKKEEYYLSEQNSTKEFKSKSVNLQKLINQTLSIIHNFGIPLNSYSNRMKEKMALNLLTLANMDSKQKTWKNAKDISTIQLKTREILKYVNENFDEKRSSGSYDDVRRKELKPLVLANIVLKSKPNAATNDSTRGYGISKEYGNVIRKFGTKEWDSELKKIIKEKGLYSKKIASREENKVDIVLPNKEKIFLSLGIHNVLQKKIIEELIARPHFCPDPEILYLGDTAKKQIINNSKKLESLNFFELNHDMLPDVIVYSKKKNWVYLIEAVYTSNPISDTRKYDLSKITEKCKSDIIYISAFMNKTDFRKFISDIAWETEVWIADDPDHMIHFNGHKFLGPF
jgi:hypothetical protein